MTHTVPPPPCGSKLFLSYTHDFTLHDLWNMQQNDQNMVLKKKSQKCAILRPIQQSLWGVIQGLDSPLPPSDVM